MNAALVAIPLLPLAAAALCWVLPRRSPLAGAVAALAPLLAAALVALVPEGARVSLTWLSVGSLSASLGLRADGLARVMALFVGLVCAAVNLYAIGYTAGDQRRARFFAWMSAFSGAMLALVLADSLVLLFFAWELVGLASYALIAHHHREPEARSAATRAFVVTRAGDLAFLLALALVFAQLGSTELGALDQGIAQGQLGGAALHTVAFGLLIAAVAKSAQLPLSAWLPGAMVAPTPVSALLHSATMVAAGVFLIARTWPGFSASLSAQAVLVGVGAATALAAALVATGARDLKRLLAWSTISQLGEMMLVLGLASPSAALFHLVTHGSFKAALFAVAGSIDQRAGTRELSRLGGLARRAPYLAASFALAGLALASVPPLAGFYSGEAMLGSAAAASPLWAALLCLNVFLGGVYVSRAFGAVFLPWPGAPRPALEPARRLSLAGIAPLVAGAVAIGLALKHPLEQALAFASPPAPSTAWKAVEIAASILGIGLGLARVMRRGPVPTFVLSWRAIERSADVVTAAPARATIALAVACRQLEAGLDAVARGLARAASATAQLARGAELGLDRASRASAGATARVAAATEVADTAGIGAGVDRAAAQLGRAGGALRGLQSGQIYHYAAALFVWALAAGLIAVAFWS